VRESVKEKKVQKRWRLSFIIRARGKDVEDPVVTVAQLAFSVRLRDSSDVSESYEETPKP
jgi:hypothetical protein